jgi:uncharacterized membrane protein
MSKDLTKRGFKFVGTTICYAFMQATGMVNDHAVECFRYRKVWQSVPSSRSQLSIVIGCPQHRLTFTFGQGISIDRPRRFLVNSSLLLFALGIGVVAGLRAMTAPAVVAWAAYLGWLNLAGTHFAFMGSKWAVAIFSLAAIGELVNDQLPKTPARTSAGPLAARVVTGALTGSCLVASSGVSIIAGALLGAVGGVIGAFAGYKARVGLVKSLSVPDFVIAIPEDLAAIGLALLLVQHG